MIGFKRNLVTSLVILIPMLVGLMLWHKLPDSLPTHFTLQGAPNAYSNKFFVVFLLPMLLLVVHWVCLIVTQFDSKKLYISPKMIRILSLITPGVSLLLAIVIYGYVLQWHDASSRIGFLCLSVVMILIGNYLPKVKPNDSVGIRLPLVLENINSLGKIHRFIGRFWVLAGFVMFFMSLLVQKPSMYLLIMMVLSILLPLVSSFFIFRKR